MKFGKYKFRTFSCHFSVQAMLETMNDIDLAAIDERKKKIKELDFSYYLITGKFPDR